jgi:hypothetical protein
MIIAVSIVDRHKYDAANPGGAHVGTYMFGVPEVDASASHYEVAAFPCEAAQEEALRRVPFNKLLDREAMLALGPCVNGRGADVSE